MDAEFVNEQVVLVVTIIVNSHIFGSCGQDVSGLGPAGSYIGVVIGQLYETAEVVVGGGIQHLEIIGSSITFVIETNGISFIGV